MSQRIHSKCFKNSVRLTESSHKDKCDIRRIVKSALKTGSVDHLAPASHFSDMIGIPDFKTAMDQIAQAKSTFASLPAKVRLEFRNDPAAFVAAAQDPSQADRFVKLGLATLRQPPKEPDDEKS